MCFQPERESIQCHRATPEAPPALFALARPLPLANSLAPRANSAQWRSIHPIVLLYSCTGGPPVGVPKKPFSQKPSRGTEGKHTLRLSRWPAEALQRSHLVVCVHFRCFIVRKLAAATFCHRFRLAHAHNWLFIQGSFEIIELTHLSDGEGRNAKRSQGKIPAAPDEPFLPSNSTVITLEQMGSLSFHFSLQVQRHECKVSLSCLEVKLTIPPPKNTHNAAASRQHS